MNDEKPQPETLPPLLGEPEREDLLQVHQALLKREQAEPTDGLERAPWWVWAVSAVTIFAMGFYLGRYGGSFNADPHTLYETAAGPAQAQAAVAAVPGNLVFATICAPCHQTSGAGIEGQYPPLAGSEWAGAADPGLPVRIVLNGLQGPITVKGKNFSNQMPALGPQLSDEEIAAVLTFVRSSFGNKAGPVDAALVKKVRAEIAGQGPWTADKLKPLLGGAK
jgi:mono/diheme cytochrome c family protein